MAPAATRAASSQANHARVLLEPMEPRYLLSADFLPAAAVAMGDGLDQFGDRLNDFLSTEELFDTHIPFLLSVEKNENGNVVDEAATIRDLFTVPVDVTGNGEINGREDQLDALDTGNVTGTLEDGDQVDLGEFLQGWFFEPAANFLRDNISTGDETSKFEQFILGSGPFSEPGLDQELNNLGGLFDLSFEVTSITDTTEDPDAEASFDIDFELGITVKADAGGEQKGVPIDLGIEADTLRLLPFEGNLEDPSSANPPLVEVDSTLAFGFEFVVQTGGQDSSEIDAADFLIRSADPLVASVSSEETGLEFGLNIGFLGATVSGGEFDLQADVEATLLDPNDPDVLGFQDSQHGIEETNGTVEADAPLTSEDLAHDAGFFLRIGNLGVATEVTVAADDDNATNADLVADIESALDTAGLTGLIEVGLVGGDTLEFSLVETTSNALGFANEDLSETGELTGTPAGTGPTDFEYLVDQVLMLSLGGALPRLVTLRFPDPARKDIGFDFHEDGDLQDDLVGQNTAVANGQLSADATFSIRVTATNGDTAVTGVTIDSDATDGTDPPDPTANASRADLAADINAAFTAAGIDTEVTAKVVGDSIALEGIGDTGALEITAANAITEDEIGLVAGQKVTPELLATDAANADLSGDATFDISLNGGAGTTVVVTADDNASVSDLAADIEGAIGNPGIEVAVSGGKILVRATDSTIGSFDIDVDFNENIGDLVDDVNAALGAAGFDTSTEIEAQADGGDLKLVALNGESLEISRTLTFDAGVTLAELLPPSLDPDGSTTEELFSAGEGLASNISLKLPVTVNPGLNDGTGSDWDPADVAIVGNFNPFGDFAQFDPDEQRFDLDLAETPAASVPEPGDLTDDEIQLVNFAELLQFNVVSADSMVGLLRDLGNALDQHANSGQFALYGIPFSGASLADVLALGDMLEDELIYDVGSDGERNSDPDASGSDLGDDGEQARLVRREVITNDDSQTVEFLPAFVTAQELATDLEALLGTSSATVDVNATYNPIDGSTDGNQLSYTVSLVSDDRVSVGVDDPNTDDTESFEQPFEFDVDLSPFTDAVIDATALESAKVTLSGRNSLDMTFGVDLEPALPISGETKLDQLNSKTGTGLKTERAITAEDPVASIFGLANDATFQARIGSDPAKTVTVSKNDVAETDGSLGEFVGVLEDAFDLALGAGAVTVSITGENQLVFTTTGAELELIPVSSDPSAVAELGFGSDPADLVGTPSLTAEDSAPRLFALSGDAGFMLKVTSSSLDTLTGVIGDDQSVTIRADETQGNRNLSALASDVNNALRAAGLLVFNDVTEAEEGIRAAIDAGRLVLTATDDSTQFEVEITSTAADDPGDIAEQELGLAAGVTVADQADLVIVDRGTDTNGPVTHRVSLDGLDPATADINDLFDLVIAQTGGAVTADFNSGKTGLRLTDANPGGDTRPSIEVGTINGSQVALKLGLLTNPSNPDDPDNEDSDKPARDPDFIEGSALGVQALRDRMFVRNASFGAAFTMDLPASGVDGDALAGIVDTDITVTGSLGAELAVDLQAPGEPAGSLVTLADLRTGVGEGDPAKRVIGEPSVNGLRTLEYDGQGAFESPFTPGAILEGDDSGASAVILAVDDQGASGTLTLFNVDGTFDDDESLFDTAGGIAHVDGSISTASQFGEFALDFTVKPGFGTTGFGPGIADALDALTGTVPIDLAGFGSFDSNPALDAADKITEPTAILEDVPGNLGDLNDFVDLGYEELKQAIEGLETLILELESNFGLLDQTLPVVNVTVGELLDLSDGFSQSVDNLSEVIDDAIALRDAVGEDPPTLTLQGIAATLRGAFGLADDSTGIVVDRVIDDGDTLLTLEFDLADTISSTLGLDIDLSDAGLPNLTSGKVLELAGDLGLDFRIGIDLDDPSQVFLFNPDGGLDGGLDITGSGADGLGMVFQATVGKLPVMVRDGLVDIDLDFDLGGLDFSGEPNAGRKLLSEVEFGDFTESTPTEVFDVSIPLFDLEGGFTDFIGEIASDVGTLLGGLDLPDLSGLAARVEQILDELQDFNPLDNLLLAADNIDFFLQNLQDFFDLEVFDLQLPIIGDNLSEAGGFIEEFRTGFVNDLRNRIESTTDLQVEHITNEIDGFFTGLDFDDVSVTDEANLTDIDPEERFAQWNINLGNTFNVPFDLGFDVGVPLLNMEADIPLSVEFDWSLDWGFGVSFDEGAYIDISDASALGTPEPDISVGLTVELPEAETFSGRLGFLALEVINRGSGVQIDFGADLSNDNGSDTRLGFSDLGAVALSPTVSGGKLPDHDAIIDLDLAVGINAGDFTSVLPRITADFILDWGLAEGTLLGDLNGDALRHGLEKIALEEIKVDAGSFLVDLLGPVLDEITSITEPFDEIIDVLTAPIAVVSDLAGKPVTLLDIAGAFGEVDTAFIDWIENVLNVIDIVNDIAGAELGVLIGDLVLFGGEGGDLVELDGLFGGDNTLAEEVGDLGAIGSLIGSAEDFLANLSTAETDDAKDDKAKQAIERLQAGDLSDLFQFPLLEQPERVAGLLIGQDLVLVRADIPRLFIDFEYTQQFPIFGPLVASVGLGFAAGIDLSFGFDTFGIRRFGESGFTNPALIFDGFFLGDREDVTEGADIPELFFEFNLTVAAELSLAIARAGVGLQGTATIGFDWFDPDGDGAIHLSELRNTIENQLRSDNPGLAPLSIFDLTGELTLELLAFLIIDFGVFEVEYEFPITSEIEVFSFNLSVPRPPILATDLGDGTLQLNMGPNAIDRLNGDTRDGNEDFNVELNDQDEVLVSSSSLGVGTPQNYGGGFDRIVAVGGQGDDRIAFEGFDGSDITYELRGGVGNDEIVFIEDPAVTGTALASGGGALIRGGRGNDTLIGGHLNDIIFGGEGNDTIEGGRGYDTLFGDAGVIGTVEGERFAGSRVDPRDGDDIIRGGSSDMTLAGQDLDDVIVGGGGDDKIWSDAGADVVLADGGRVAFGLTGMDEDARIDVGTLVPTAFVPNDPLDPAPDPSTSEQIQAIFDDLTANFTGTDLGNGGDDELHGGAGNDLLFGGSANDTIDGDGDGDHIVGGLGFDTLRGGDDDDVMFGNAQNDEIEGNSGSDVIDGGFGDDVIHGNAGNDFLQGGRGMDVMFGDSDNDEVWGQGEPDVLFGGTGDDLVIGGVAADIVFGDDGIVAKLDPDDEPGAMMEFADIVVGNGNPLTLITTAMRDTADDNAGSLDLILTDVTIDDGNDILSGNAGGDIVLGGGGSDVIGGDVDPRLAVADSGAPGETTESGDDLLIGDGGIVQFDQRKLQRVASVFADDVINAKGYQDTIYGNNGDDVLIGGRGSDSGTNQLDDGNRPRILAGGHGPGRGVTDSAASDEDIIIGDNGELTYADGTIADNFGVLERIRTTDGSDDTGGADTVFGEIGDDIIFGGVNGSMDVLNGNLGDDVLLGDNGELNFAFDGDTDLATLDLIRSFTDGLGGVDEISGNAGADTLIGGTGGDQIFGDDISAGAGSDDGEDIAVGDNADIFLSGSEGRIVIRDTAVEVIETTDTTESTGGADTIRGNAQTDIVIGGVNDGGDDTLFGDAGVASLGSDDADDLILGDNGLLHFNFDWQADGADLAAPKAGPGDDDQATLDLIRSFTDGLGGDDSIAGNVGGDLILGGSGADTIHGDNANADAAADDGDDIALGDNGDVFLSGTEGTRIVLGAAVSRITTTDDEEGTGGDDLIEGNAGADILLGGVNDGGIDRLHGDARAPADADGKDVLLGDNGLLDFGITGTLDDLDLIETTARASDGTTVLGGMDRLFGNAGNDIALGGSDDDLIIGDNDKSADDSGVVDTLTSDPGRDTLIGDQGRVVRENDLVTLIETTDVALGGESENVEGGADVIQGNDLADIILGGVDGDVLHGEAELVDGMVGTVVGTAGADKVVGDEGRLIFDVTAGARTDGDGLVVAGDDNAMTLDVIETFATGSLGNDDIIHGNGGNDIVMGGSANDAILGDFYLGSAVEALAPGEDMLLGDGGEMTFIDEAMTLLRTIEPGQGGADTIQGNDLNDVVMGGFNGDLLYGEAPAADLGLIATGAGDDVILGDNGRMDWILPDDDILGRQDVQDHLGGTSVDLDPDAATLDRVTTTDPTLGGNDVIYGNGNANASGSDIIFGGTGADTVRGDTSDAGPGADGVDGRDVVFGDHAKRYASLAAVDSFFVNNDFFSIDTASGDDGAGDVLFGNANDDILIGGQGDDIAFGGTGDDDLIGGHNIAGSNDPADGEPAHDDLDGLDPEALLALAPGTLVDLDPADVNELNDILDGGADDDVIAGDNAIVIRQPNDVLDDPLLSPRFRIVGDAGQAHRLVSNNVAGLADIDVGFEANVTDALQPHQHMTLVRTVTLLDHSEATGDAAVESAGDPRPFGNDVIAGGSEDDEIFGQLGDDIQQGDGAIGVISPAKGDFDPFDPAQDADPSFDLRNFSIRVDLDAGNDTAATLRFGVFEALADGDDYLEGNGGSDRMYGNLGQDDLIGGSSTLFGLGDTDAAFHGVAEGVLLRPDGADLIYGGAGNPSLLERNASIGGTDNDVSVDTLVPAAERHATDADTILGDNGNIFRLVTGVDSDGNGTIDDTVYERFNYDRDATTADGFVDDGFGSDALIIRPRAVSFSDYGYAYVDEGGPREALSFTGDARGEGDLIYGESGDDVIHGMTGNDVAFGNSGHDDLHGEIGTDFLLGGTGIDGIVGDDGLVLTSRNSDDFGEPLHGIDALNPDQGDVKKNEEVDTEALNAVISTPGNIQLAVINIENELTKEVELFAFRTDDLDGNTQGKFDDSLRFNDVIFGGLDNDFIHAGDGDDAVSGAEALPAYHSGTGFGGFEPVNAFLQDMQSAPPNETPDLADEPFWFAFAPYNPGDILRFEGKNIVDGNGQNPATRDEFAWYDEFNPRRKLMFDFDFFTDGGDPDQFQALDTEEGVGRPIDFLLNFDANEGPDGPTFEGDDVPLPTDGADRAFGDLGNDWQVGGSGRDHMYGGRGDDLVNMDDNHDSGAADGKPNDPEGDPLDNTRSDEFQAYADIVYSGAGRDVMLLNTGADRAIDWVGEYNSYIVPFSPFGAFHISRTLQPQVPEFLQALSVSDGVDTRVDAAKLNNVVDAQLFVDQKALDVRTDDPDPARNGEPYGELGMVRQTDFDWQQQTGAPNDPQPGNFNGKREIMRRELFQNPETVGFAADVGTFSVANGEMEATPDVQDEETVSLYHLDELQPDYMEILVTVDADKDKQGWNSNAYVIFDYQGPTDFKFAGINPGVDKIQIGQRTPDGWVVDTQTAEKLWHETEYGLTVVLHGSIATIWVDQQSSLSLDFGEPLNDNGMIGLGTDNAVARFDDFQVQKLPPLWTLEEPEPFTDADSNPFTLVSGDWQQADGHFDGTPADGEAALATRFLDVAAFSRLELGATLQTTGQGGLVFDYYDPEDFKFVALDVASDRVVVGHGGAHGFTVDAATSVALDAGTDHDLAVSLLGTAAAVTLDGQAVLGHVYNALLNDGGFGLLGQDGTTSFDSTVVRSDDPAFATDGDGLLAAAGASSAGASSLEGVDIEAITDEAISRLDLALGLTEAQRDALERVGFRVVDLPGLGLARTQDRTIEFDVNAAGHGWFVDLSPGDDAEFPRPTVDGRLAVPASEAHGHMDLLTAATHEFGHLVGLDHADPAAFMNAELSPGTRLVTLGLGVTAPGPQAASTAQEGASTRLFDEAVGDFLDAKEARWLASLDALSTSVYAGQIDDYAADAEADEEADEAADPVLLVAEEEAEQDVEGEPADAASLGSPLEDRLSSLLVDWTARFDDFRA